MPNTYYEQGWPHLWLPYTQMQTIAPPPEATRTEGSHITLSDGRTLIDGVAAWWTACHGYNHPHIRQAVTRQLETMPHTMFGGMVHRPALDLAARLGALLPGDLERVFFTDSGSVAMEVAIKMAIQYWLNKGETGRTKLLAFQDGYHGDTIGTMAICDPEEGMHSLFADSLPQHIIAPLPRDDASIKALDDLIAKHKHELAAIVVEPLIQGAGGMIFHDRTTLRRLRTLADKHNLLLILDEIFTGFGRTGTMFACQSPNNQSDDIVPDIIALSKALTGGTMALAATIARRHVFEAFLSDNPMHALMHGPTFMANPLACSAANASLDLFETEPRLEQVKTIETQLKDELAPCRAYTNVRDVRIKGAVGVVELDRLDNPAALRAQFLEAGVWIRPFRRIAYLTPAFTIQPDDLSRLTETIRHILR